MATGDAGGAAEQNDTFDPFAGPSIETTAPSTEPQREIWTAAHLGREASLAFNESITLRLRGRLDVPALQAALEDLVRRHEALRSTFTADGLTMVVSGTMAVKLPVVEEPLSVVQARAVEEPFDLTRGPLFRAWLVRLGPEDHAAIFSAHHIACDGWSTGVLVREWANLYSARQSGIAVSLPPANRFSEYARHHREAPEDQAYWLAQFQGEPPVLELPLDRPRPPLKTYASARVDVALGEALTALLRKAGARMGASPFNVLLAGFEALLHRLSGQEDLVVGVPTAGQSIGGHERLVGHCVNTLPLRQKIDPDKPFRDLVASGRRTLLDALDHQRFTFGTLLRLLPLRRDPSRLPLVSVCFNLDRGLTPDQLPFAGLQPSVETNPRRAENFDLFLNAVDLGSDLALECQYNTDLFDESTVRRWLSAYALLVEAAATDPALPVARLPLLAGAERDLLEKFSGVPRPWDASLRVHDLIEQQVARTPDAIAVDPSLTFGELDLLASSLARHLHALGVRPGDCVGLCVERGPQLVVGLLAVLKSGAAYVPLDPGYPSDRLRFMVEDSGLRVLVTERQLRGEVPLPAQHVVCIDDPVPGSPSFNCKAGPGSPAYVIYTSGSTGKPKGVLVPHGAAVNLLRHVQREPGLSARDVVLAITTLSFDIAVSELILPLTVGARIVIATRDQAADGASLRTLLRDRGVTFVDATPATWRLLLAAGWEGDPSITAVCTGEALPHDLAAALAPRVGSLWNGYGPTETTVWSTFWRVPRTPGRVLIGKPLDGTTAYILDARGERTPLGVPGELYLGGAQVALGYLNRPELTGQRFLPDPFVPGGRMYRTGDLARWLPDGTLECLGRTDHQVKLRGYRIELGEIENALAHGDGVDQAAVVLREDRPGDKRLAGYFTGHADDASLRAHLKTTLPEYMIPAHFVRLAAMPLTPSGKIDRKALPAPSANAARATFLEARTESEKLVARLFAEALGVGRVSADDDFFALGGHSLLAAQVLSRLHRDHSIEFSFRKIFEAPTVAALAALIDASERTEAVTIPKLADPGRAPLSVMQERILFLEELESAQKLIHNLPAAWQFEGQLDAGALETALQRIAGRHSTLRTSFHGGEQQVAAFAALALQRVDLTAEPPEKRAALMATLFDAEAQRPMDPACAPLFRSALVRLDKQTHTLFILPHSLVWDGWSFDVFLRELTATYAALSEGRSPELRALPLSYGDFAAWQRKWLESPRLARQAAFWNENLTPPAPDLELPTDRARPQVRTYRGANQSVHFTPAEAELVQSFARERGVTLYMVLLAAFDVLLHRYSGATDLVVGTPVRGRPHPDLEDLIGLFINAIPLRVRIEPEQPFEALLAHVREVTLQAFSHQDLPLEALGDRAPALRAFFSLQDARTRPTRAGALEVSQVHVPYRTAANDVMLWMMQTADGLLAVLNFSTDLFDSASAARMLRQFRSLLLAAARNPQTAVDRLPLDAGTPSLRIGAPGGLLHRLASRHGAAIFAGDVTWADLNRRAAPLSGALAGMRRVGINTARGVDEAVACLAAWRAGAAVARLAGEAEEIARSARRLGLDAIIGSPIEELRCIALDASAEPVDQPGGVAFIVEGPGATPLDLTHETLSCSARAAADALGLRGGAALVWSAPAGTDAAAFEMALAFVSGASVVTSSWEDLSVPAGAFVAAPASALSSVDGARAVCLDVPPQSAPLAGVRFALRAGPLWAGLGVAAADGGRLRYLPLSGVPIDVIDAHGVPCAVGVPGALWCFGAATGDLGRVVESGAIELLGRVDRQVTLAGRRIQLEEVESALCADPAVEAAAAGVRDNRLTAFVIAAPGASFTETELRQRMRERVPPHLVPRSFEEVDRLPTARELATDDRTRAQPRFVEPRTQQERLLAETWQKALGLERVGAQDNFFDLGGHSLLCMQVLDEIETATGQRLSPRSFLLGNLEQIARELQPSATAPAEAPARQVGLLERLRRRMLKTSGGARK